MVNDEAGRRKYRRVFYSVEDRMIGSFMLPGKNNEIITVNIMNMSIGGLHFTLRRDENIQIREGDRLILTKIVGNTSQQIVANIETEIKWVLDHHLMKHIGFGCEFIDMPDMLREQINDFVNSDWNPVTKVS